MAEMNVDTDGLELGDEVEDPITGFVGRVIGFTQWLSGCAVASVQPPMTEKDKKDGSMPEYRGYDVTRLQLVKHSPLETQRSTGGPQPTPPPQHGIPSR